MTAGPVPLRGARTAAYQRIRDDIGNGALAPGEWVREGTLADTLGVSRTPVREALNALAAEGVVEIVRHRGARVSRWTARDVDEVYSLRALLEGQAARLAVERAAPEVARELAQHEQRFADAGGALSALRAAGHGEGRSAEQALDAAVEANGAFHRVVVEAADSPRLGALLASVSSAPLVTLAFQHYTDDDLARSRAGHRDVVLGLEHRDPSLAEAAMRSHILGARHAAARSAAEPSGRARAGPGAQKG